LVLPCDEVGAGPVLVLIHAGVADRTMWAEHLQPLADAGHRVIAPDLPAYGDAPVPAEDAPWNDVVETLDALGVEQAALVGNSFGGAVALRVAAVVPDRVRALMLVSAPPPGLEPSAQLQAAWEAEGAAIEAGDLEAAVQAVVDAWTQPGAGPALRERVAAMQRRSLTTMLAAPEPPEGPDPLGAGLDALGAIAVPALVAAGELDMPDFLTGAEAMAAGLPNARHQVIPGAGHLAPLETPDAFRELVLGFAS
jgi:pimeloyl-ACP methyl ester carboxylesterase